MAAPFDLNDDSVVVIIGTGAGGGVLANELAQKGVSVVSLEAGGRYLPWGRCAIGRPWPCLRDGCAKTRCFVTPCIISCAPLIVV